MRNAPLRGVDLGVYAAALPLLIRNPALVVVPLLTLVVGVLLRQVIAPFGGGAGGSLTVGLAQFAASLLMLYGLGSACILADDAWRRGHGSFETSWTRTQTKSGDLLYAAIGIALLVSVGQYVGVVLGGVIGDIAMAVAAFFLIWTMPAAAIGGVPGGAAIQVSIERVRSVPLAAGIATAVTLLLVLFVPPLLIAAVAPLLGVAAESVIALELIVALVQAITMAYVALVLTKTYSDASFRPSRW